MFARKRLIPLFLILLMLVVNLPMKATAQQKTTITWLTLDWKVEEVIKAFEADNPDITVQVEQAAFNDLFQQIQVRLGSGSTSPDVIAVDVPLTASYANRGWLLPLDEAFSKDEVADWLPSSVQAGTINGKLVSAPVSTSTQLLYYNKALFAKAGITPPGPDERWTWEKIAEVAPKLTFDENNDGTPDIWGFNWEQMARIYQLQVLPASLGGEAIGQDGLTVDGVINSDAWIKAFTYYYDMYNTLKVSPQGDDSLWSPDIFEPGKLAMFVGGPWDIRRFAEAKLPFEWGVSRHPYFKDGKIVTPTGSWHIGVNAKTEHKEAALKFVHWITTGKGAETWWRKGSGDFPAQQSVLKKFQTDPEFEKAPLSFLRIAADESTVNPVPRPTTVGYLEYEQILQNTFNDMRNGVKPKEALDTAVTRISSEMAKYKK
jgi:ABC-type glycerol-3-phosphate transport system substrate-binding protein